MDIDKLLPFRARGLRDLEKRIGDIAPFIDEKLKTGKQIRILETGFGFGVTLMELRKKYGAKVELHGINKMQSHGDWSTIQTVAIQQGIFSERELKDAIPPTITFHDVSRGLPYPNDYFDLVYSQVSYMFYDEKASFLEEVNRVLSKEGTGRIDLYIHRPGIPIEYATSFEIWDGEKQIPFWDYIKRFSSLQERTAKRRSFLEMTKIPSLDLRLELAYAIDLNSICKGWQGRKSIYKVRLLPQASPVHDETLLNCPGKA